MPQDYVFAYCAPVKHPTQRITEVADKRLYPLHSGQTYQPSTTANKQAAPVTPLT